MRVCVTGAGGFVGSHLVKFLKGLGYWVRGVDIKHPEFSESLADEFLVADLREYENCIAAVSGVKEVYHLAADMGGIGWITVEHAQAATNNVLIDVHMLRAANTMHQVDRFFYSSSACAYPVHLQDLPLLAGLRESDAIPANPEPGYGWEKLYAEQLCKYYREDYGLETRVARFHNVYGPEGTFTGGREKAPAALCRKVSEAPVGGYVDVWGDGLQTRSFIYVNDCVDGIYRIMRSDYTEPINLGSERLITIKDLAQTIIDISGRDIRMTFDKTKPQGVRGRNSDNTLLREVTGWEPETSLEQGLEETYLWVYKQTHP